MIILTQKIAIVSALLWLCACASVFVAAPVTKAQTETFGPLAALAGHTFASEAVDASQAPSDVSTWAFDLGGRVLVNRHALSDGSYGGVTHIYRNAKTGALDYVYVTSAGFHTTGSFTVLPDGGWTAEEAVTGHKDITRVRSTGRLRADGTMRLTSEYLSRGVWSPGRDVIYRPTDKRVQDITPTP